MKRLALPLLSTLPAYLGKPGVGNRNYQVRGIPMRKHRLALSGLSMLAALWLVASIATSAQAETGANWMINGSNIANEMLLPPVEINEIENINGGRHLVLLTTVGVNTIAVLCTGLTLEEIKLKLTGSSLGKARFTGCTFLANGKVASACTPYPEKEEGEEGIGRILTRLLKGLIVLHSPAPGTFTTLNRIEPEEGNIIVSFNLGLEEECAYGALVSVTGKLFLEDGEGEFKQEKVRHLFLQGPLTALTFLNNAANIDGSVITLLSGGHAGLKWSGLPA